MYSKFCSIKQLENILKLKEEIKGFNILITQTATFEILIWIENSELIDMINVYIEMETSDLDYEDDQKFIERIEFMTDVEVDEDDELKQELLSHHLETSIYPHLNSWIGEKKSKKLDMNAPIVTFYSYKGGVGRSTSLAIVARQLSEVYDKKVVILDFDVEAPGQYYLFKDDSTCKYGVIDYLRHQLHLNNGLNEDQLKNYYTKIKKSEGEVYLFNTYGESKNYLDKLAYVDFDMFVRSNRNYVNVLLKNIDEIIKPDIILIDSRTGFSEISGIFINNSDLVNVFLGFSGQNDFGIETILESYLKNSRNPVYAPNYIFNFSVLPEEKSVEDYATSKKILVDRTYQIMKKVFGKRLNEPDFGENAINFNFIYRHKLLEENNSENLDDFTALDFLEYADMDGIMKMIKTNNSAFINQILNRKSNQYKISKNEDVKEYQLILEKTIELINIKNIKQRQFEKDDVIKILNEINYEDVFKEHKFSNLEKNKYKSGNIYNAFEAIMKRTYDSSNSFAGIINQKNKSLSKSINGISKNNKNKANNYYLLYDKIIGSKLDETSIISSESLKWFSDYFSDSKNNISSNDIIYFFRKMKEEYLGNIEKYYDGKSNRLFPLNLFCTKEIYSIIAKNKLELLCKEYDENDLCKVLNAVHDTKDIEFPINVYEFVVKLGKSMNMEKNDDIINYIDLLIELGVLDKKNEELNMKPIYLEAFNKKNSKYSFYNY